MGKKILLADDSITIQKVIELTFSDEDFEVVTVGNGRLALEKLSEVRPDIVLCDIIMPEKDGYEVCEQIKKNAAFSGMMMSQSTMSGRTSDSFSSARRPLPTVTTSKSSSEKVSSITFWMVMLSSASRIFLLIASSVSGAARAPKGAPR